MLFIVRTDDFDFELPKELIAQEPSDRRDGSRLLVVERDGPGLIDAGFRQLGSFLRPGDMLVLNDTRVMAARLRGRWDDTGGGVELLLITERAEFEWSVLINPARRAKPGRSLTLAAGDGELEASVQAREGETVVVRFNRAFDVTNVGEIPLPPYIQEFKGDESRYQTVYARAARSAAAPTAGLHFTKELMHELEAAAVRIAYISLDVGPGTFLPVRTDDPSCHAMHAERFELPIETATALREVKAAGGRVVAVGTTVVRALEAAWSNADLTVGRQETDILILPGHRFRVIDALITNFHLPRSTLLMLVSSFMGRESALAAYSHAVTNRYRFYSFGDAMFIS